ncbi:MAG TPA: hypothetical protein DCQ64_12595 [Candidatus Rokubacteria bacterium]|nr:hypothetical protein [Candidatus Rokubacteria bacterium]
MIALSRGAGRLLRLLHRKARQGTVVVCSKAELALQLGAPRRSVQRWVHELERHGLLASATKTTEEAGCCPTEYQFTR